jgi:rhodanese-related sulfurtransferase
MRSPIKSDDLNSHPQDSRNQQWVVSAAQAKQRIEQGATILDARTYLEWLVGHVPEAVHVNWKHFSQQQSPDKGKLLENLEILEQSFVTLVLAILDQSLSLVIRLTLGILVRRDESFGCYAPSVIKQPPF